MPVSYIIFAKYPVAGSVKTRLARTIGAESACMLYEAMLRDTIARVAARATPTLVCVHPAAESANLARRVAAHAPLPPHVEFTGQYGANLGERMYRAFLLAAERQAMPAIMLGTDSPTIPAAAFEQAEQLLARESSAAVIGPSDDGGFYMLGLPAVHPQYFFGAEYSHAQVFERTWRALQQHYSRVYRLPDCYDIDDSASLQRLRREIDKSGGHVCPETVKALSLLEAKPEASPYEKQG